MFAWQIFSFMLNEFLEHTLKSQISLRTLHRDGDGGGAWSKVEQFESKASCKNIIVTSKGFN